MNYYLKIKAIGKEGMFYSENQKQFEGTYLYKYYSYNENPAIMFAPIIKKTLRYKDPLTFNDPYDCYIAANDGRSINSIRKREMETVYVASLTRSYTNLLMWSHYASQHKGFVVKYNIQKIYEQRPVQFEAFKYVNYSNDIIVLKTFDFLNSKNTEEALLQAIFHKAKCWRYEHEVRGVIYRTFEIGSKREYADINISDSSIEGIYLGACYFKETQNILPKNIYDEFSKKIYFMQLQSDEMKLKPYKLKTVIDRITLK